MKKYFWLLVSLLFITTHACKNEVVSNQEASSAKVITDNSYNRKVVATSQTNSDKISIKKEEKSSVHIKERVFEAKKEDEIQTKKTSSTINTKNTSTKKSTREDRVKAKIQEKGKLSFLADSYDFGFVEMGEVVDHSFTFKNTGNRPINISNATATCGCTTPVFPFIPIEPGKQGKIDVRFNSKGRLGPQLATIKVFSDAENPEIELEISGTVRTDIASPSEFIDTTNQ